MRYPDNVLADGEQVVLHRHPHWKRLVGAVTVLILASGLASFVAGFVNTRPWDPNAKNVIFGVIWTIWLVLVGWLTVWPFLAWLTTHFVITDRRVMFRHGVLSGSGIDIPLARIFHVEFRQGIVDRMLRAGTLIIESASQDSLEFYDIPRVRQVHALLYHEVFDTLEPESPS
ncbi:membrane-flanked domain-containing protein [Mycobacterium xenopi RIVM700367]|uniref:PH domain-containing protein n=1 Tax=Mycobacterium xenopi TaxID=1789 RepID=UPI00025ACEC1|nr:PH domain-containing protein [Mycobacterium xenopi]EID16938.1 membrane-flanked domain-containing protein [Mycobacterium xenopi RIVM700367]